MMQHQLSQIRLVLIILAGGVISRRIVNSESERILLMTYLHTDTVADAKINTC